MIAFWRIWHFMSRKHLNKGKLMYLNCNYMIYLLTCYVMLNFYNNCTFSQYAWVKWNKVIVIYLFILFIYFFIFYFFFFFSNYSALWRYIKMQSCFTMFIGLYSFVISEIVYVRHVTCHVMFVFVLYDHGPNGLMLNKVTYLLTYLLTYLHVIV